MSIFNYLGYLFGYILWFFFDIVKNYGVAIIFFGIVINLIMFPLSAKQRKSMAKTARISSKQQELQKKYANDKQKYNEEVAKLYQDEGVPLTGCLTSFIPLFMMLGIYRSVLSPLQNTLHIAGSKVASAITLLGTIPGIGNSFNTHYGEIEIVKLFPFIKDQLTMFNGEELQNIGDFYQGFDFLGLDLLGTPNASSFSSMLWIIPVLCFLSSAFSTFLIQKMQGNQMQGQGCMKYMMYSTAFLSAWFAYSVPAAVGFYWIVSTTLGLGQNVILNHFYNVNRLNARDEAARVALRLQQEALIERLPADQVEHKAVSQTSKTRNMQANKTSNKKKSSKNKTKTDYLKKSK